MENKLIIAGAGSGKTRFLIERVAENPDRRTLITTYTDANGEEIRRKLLKHLGYIPENVVIQNWFSFLLEHGVRPYQGDVIDTEITGMMLVNTRSGLKTRTYQGHPVYFAEDTETERFYLAKDGRIFSDKISRFVLRCDKHHGGKVIERLSRVFRCVMIDEVQDLAGCDLDLILKLLDAPMDIVMVGDPRQVTYLTHREQKNKNYEYGRIADFIKEKKKKKTPCEIDEEILAHSHRNNAAICAFSSSLYPQLNPTMPCTCDSCRSDVAEHQGIFLVRPEDVLHYLGQHDAVQLRWDRSVKVERGFSVHNLGASKGLTFDHVLIYPTGDMVSWLKDRSFELKPGTKAKLYVGITRARHSVAIVYQFNDEVIEGVENFGVDEASVT